MNFLVSVNKMNFEKYWFLVYALDKIKRARIV